MNYSEYIKDKDKDKDKQTSGIDLWSINMKSDPLLICLLIGGLYICFALEMKTSVEVA